MFKDKVKPEAGATEKMQTSQDIEHASSAVSMGKDVPSPSPVVEKSTKDGTTLKQEKVAEVIASNVSGAPSVSGGTAFRMGRPSSSGSTDSTLDKANATPVGRQSRPDSRFGKKIEKTATKLNYTVSEQYEKKYVEAKPLAESPDKVQGYNGTYRNETYRTQKIAGATPAELYYDRSVDFIVKDQVYFSNGQQIVPDNLAGAFDPAEEYDVENESWITTPVNKRVARGNYIPNKLSLKFARINGQPRLVSFGVICVSANPAHNAARAGGENSNVLQELNKVEIIRETMESKAGDESNKDWSPLPKAIHDPNGWLALLRAYESSLGAEVLMAKTKFALCSSFQLNRAAKDGQNTIAPAVESFLGALTTAENMSDYDVAFNNIWSQASIAAGSAGAFIRAFDSENKYHFKADILLQPRSLKMHYQTALANSDEFYVDPRFVKAVANVETYSTYGHDYDPTLPVLMTDKAAISYPFDIGSVSRYGGVDLQILTQELDEKKYTGDEATAGFASIVVGLNRDIEDQVLYLTRTTNGSNNGSYSVTTNDDDHTVTITANSTVNGADAGVLHLSDVTSQGATTVTIPVGYTLIVKAPLTSAVRVQNDTLLPLGATEKVYAYHDVRNNYHVRVRHALFAGIVEFLDRNAAAFTKNGMFSLGVEYNLPIYHSTKYWSFWDVLVCASTPYIQQQRTNYMRDILHYTTAFGYPFTDFKKLGEIGSVPFVNFSFTNYEEELKLGRLAGLAAVRWTMPEFFWYLGYDSQAALHKYVAPWYINEENYSQAVGTYAVTRDLQAYSICWPSTRAGVKLDPLVELQSFDERDLRLSLDQIVDITNDGYNPYTYPRAYKYGRSTDGQLVFASADGITIRQMLSMPRELGWVMDAPGGFLTPAIGQRLIDVDVDDNVNGASSFRIYAYTNVNTAANKAILGVDSANIDRAANFTQTWHMADVVSAATYSVSATGAADYGVLYGASMAYDSGSPRAGKASFSPYARLGAGVPDDASGLYPAIVANHRFMYARVQQLPFIISPFDAVDLIDGGSSHYDIYDLAYVFGLCGFRASDYTEDVYNRETDAFNRGYMYTSDPWYESSALSK